MIQAYRNADALRKAEVVSNDQSAKKWARYCTLVGAIPVILKICEVLHWIPR